MGKSLSNAKRTGGKLKVILLLQELEFEEILRRGYDKTRATRKSKSLS